MGDCGSTSFGSSLKEPAGRLSYWPPLLFPCVLLGLYNRIDFTCSLDIGVFGLGWSVERYSFVVVRFRFFTFAEIPPPILVDHLAYFWIHWVYARAISYGGFSSLFGVVDSS